MVQIKVSSVLFHPVANRILLRGHTSRATQAGPSTVVYPCGTVRQTASVHGGSVSIDHGK